MNTQSINIPKAILLAVAIAAGMAVLVLPGRSSQAIGAPSAPSSAAVTGSPGATGTTLVTVLLAANTFTANLPQKATDLLTTTKGSTAARLAAQRNPYKRSESEAVAASIAENARNAALPLIQKAAAPDVAVSLAVQRKIRRLGGKIISASPIPNQVVTRIPAAALPALGRDPRVAGITPAKLPVSLAAPIDRSAIWWANGFTGQGTSADGNGSPDAVVFDTGIRTTHDYFKTRLPGDGPTSIGSGPSRVISPVVRNDFSGSKHGNTIGAQIAGTAFNPGMNPSSGVGMAYGMDKLYDSYAAYNPYLWNIGIATPRPSNLSNAFPASDPGLGGNTDLPEVINYSATIYQDTVELDPNWNYFDALESRFGILNTIGGGNCGLNTINYNGCNDGPHRIGTPGVNYNVLTMGGLDLTADPTDISTYVPWPNSSPGPTWGGRKKPDLIGSVTGTAGTPSAINDTATTSFGYGTSFAAPVAAGGALLLASSGVYLPTAQKAIMVNSAIPVQGQTYWTPRTGWGAIDMTEAFYDRGNYANGNVSGTGANSARFYQVTGVASGDRATLVWNRRTDADSLVNPSPGQITDPAYYALTDLNLSQFDPGTLAATSTGGSDAADTVDTDQTVTAANPMPGNGSDGGDNIEQIRSTATGTQIIKVKALSSVDGASTEPYSVATTNPIAALSTPIPNVTVSATPATTGLAQNVTVTATISNPSADLSLTTPTATLTIPSGVSLISGVNPRPLTTIAPSGSTAVVWTVQATTSGIKNLSVATSGTAYGETFSGSGADAFDADGTPPTLTLTQAAAYTQASSPSFTWSATDTQGPVTGYDVETATGNSAWAPLLSNTTSTSTSVAGAEGQTVQLRVRARDGYSNESPWQETSTIIDATPPVISFGPQTTPSKGQASIAVSYSNVGAPITTALYSFARFAAPPTLPIPGAPVTLTNLSTSNISATLTATVTDALGRSATSSQNYTIAPRYIAANLTLAKARLKKSTVSISGKLSSAATGKITMTIRRVSKNGTKRVTKSASIKSGRYAVKVKLKKGKYTVTAVFSGSSDVVAASAKRSFTVR